MKIIKKMWNVLLLSLIGIGVSGVTVLAEESKEINVVLDRRAHV